MPEEKVYKAEHDLLSEALSLVWEYEKPEDKIAVGYYVAGIHDMAHELLRVLDEPEDQEDEVKE